MEFGRLDKQPEDQEGQICGMTPVIRVMIILGVIVLCHSVILCDKLQTGDKEHIHNLKKETDFFQSISRNNLLVLHNRVLSEKNIFIEYSDTNSMHHLVVRENNTILFSNSVIITLQKLINNNI